MILMPEQTLRQLLQQKIDGKTKPPGALGRLEQVGLQVGLIQQTVEPQIQHPHIIVFAADHGISATGLVNPYPQAVTAQMVQNFIHGGAAINVFCRQHQIGLSIIDAGVNADFDDALYSSSFIAAKIGYGTKNYLHEPAMSVEEVQKAIESGRQVLKSIYHTGCNCVGFGEMGIGNTSSAALIMSLVMDIPIESCAGRGTGANDDQLATKTHTLQQVIQKHRDALGHRPAPVDILQYVGGFEIAMMTGAYLEAAALNMVIVVDGFITTAALLIAHAMNPAVTNHCVFAHASGEQGHTKMLAYLGAEPLLNLGMRLGEGTGAALAIPIIQSSVLFLQEMASFESASVDDKSGNQSLIF
jgi:nicotinate-nucleotide--dimethylbenzimidazole phosphoribosyltransferase